jgi:hypothetical protein
MRKMAILLWASAAWGDNSVPDDKCLASIQRLAAQHEERRWMKPTVTKEGKIHFQIRGPEAEGDIYISVGPDTRGLSEDTPWTDHRGPTPAGKTPEANWVRHLGRQNAMITVWHTDTGLVPELQRLLDGCMSSR